MFTNAPPPERVNHCAAAFRRFVCTRVLRTSNLVCVIVPVLRESRRQYTFFLITRNPNVGFVRADFSMWNVGPQTLVRFRLHFNHNHIIERNVPTSPVGDIFHGRCIEQSRALLCDKESHQQNVMFTTTTDDDDQAAFIDTSVGTVVASSQQKHYSEQSKKYWWCWY